jgi:hypothetical protein
VILSCLIVVSPQFLSVQVVIRMEFQKSYNSFKKIIQKKQL